MKHLLLITSLLCTLLFTSCDPGSDSSSTPGDYPNTACYATISIEPNIEEDGSDRYVFTTDKGLRLLLVENKLSSTYEPTEGERVVIQFYTTEDYTDEANTSTDGADYDCSYGIRLFYIYHVYTSENVVVETEEENDLYPDHAISYIYDSLVYSDGYINMIAGLRADKIDNVKFYLVENNYTEPTETVDGYLNLELRYDRGTDEAYGATYDEYVSVDVSNYLEQLEGMDGILLKVITLSSGSFHIKMPIEVE